MEKTPKEIRKVEKKGCTSVEGYLEKTNKRSYIILHKKFKG